MNKRKATGEPPERKPPSRKAKFDAIAGIKESLAVRQAPLRRLAKHPKPLTRIVDPVPVNAHQRLFDALETSFYERPIQVMRGLHYHQEFARSKHNPRNTEDSVHGLHEIEAHHLCERNCGTVTPVPQFRITAPILPDIAPLLENPPTPQWQSPGDMDISVRTECASRATTWQAIPDISLASLDMQLRGTALVDEIVDIHAQQHQPLEDSSAFSHIFSSSSYLPERFFRVEKVELPVLEELKPPFPRNTTSISQVFSHFTSFGRDAKQQARIQAVCLFSSPTFEDQHSVILLAAVGEWFAFSQMTREILDQDMLPFSVGTQMTKGVIKGIRSMISQNISAALDWSEYSGDDDERFSSYTPSSPPPPNEHVEVRRNLRRNVHLTARSTGSSDTEEHNLPEGISVAPVMGVRTPVPTADSLYDNQHQGHGPSSQPEGAPIVQATTMDGPQSTLDTRPFSHRLSHHGNETVRRLAPFSHIGDDQTTSHQQPVASTSAPPLSQGNDPATTSTAVPANAPNDLNQEEQEILEEIDKIVDRAKPPYSDDDLNQLWTFRRRLGIARNLGDSEDPTMDEHGDTNPKFVNNEQFTPPTGILWSPWMKLGSPACSSMLRHVAEEVSKKAEASETELLRQLTAKLLERVGTLAASSE